MALLSHPQVGTIVRVDLNEGFRVPEMRKRRPCVIISPALPIRDQICTIVPFSTTKPRIESVYCCEIKLDPPLPWPYDSPIMWAKSDMVMTVAFHRLKLLEAGRDKSGERVYDIRVLGPDVLAEIRRSVAHCIGL